MKLFDEKEGIVFVWPIPNIKLSWCSEISVLISRGSLDMPICVACKMAKNGRCDA
jgi:hypothetical protein